MEHISLLNRALLVLYSLVIISLPLKNTIYQISYGLFALVFLLTIIWARNFKIFLENARFTVLFLLIALSMAISNYLGVSGEDKWDLLFKFMLRYGLLFFALLYLLKERVMSTRFVLSLLVVSFSIQAFDGIYQQYTGYDFFVNRGFSSNRLMAATFSSNTLGFILFVNVGVLTYYMISAVRNGEGVLGVFLYSLLLGVSGYVLLHTGARSSWVAAIVLMTIFIALNFRRLNAKTYTIIVCLVVATAYGIVSNDTVYSRFVMLMAGQSQERIDIWLFSMEQFLSAPIFGYGLNSYAVLGGPHPSIHMPHNIMLEILVFLGLAGLALFSALFISVFMAGISVYREDKLFGSFLVAIFVAVLVGYLFDHSITDSKITNTVLFSVMAVIVGAGSGVVRRTSC